MKRIFSLAIGLLMSISMLLADNFIYVYDRTGWPTTALYAWGTSELYGGWPGALPVGSETIDNVVCKKFAFNGQSGRNYSLIFNNNNNGAQLLDFAATGGRDYTLTITTMGVVEGIDTTEVVEPEPLPTNDYVVYQANEKIFARTQAFNAIDARLDEIEALGVNVLWLMPIHPIGQKNTANSPYCVKDFKGIKTEFGTLDDLKNLINHAHAKDIKVILDWVANHSALDHPWMTEHPDWYGTPTGDETLWKDVQPFNFNNMDMRAAMIDAMTYWIDEADIDGFRCDFAQGCPDDFWAAAIDSVRARKPEAIMLAETSRTQLYAAGFNWLYSWSYLSGIQNLYKGTKTVANLYSTSDGELNQTPVDRARLRYITNHDACSEQANSSLYTNADGMLSAACLTYFLAGVPLIYSSQEIGYLNKINFCTTSQGSVLMNWNTNPNVLARTKQLMAAYHASLDLRGGTQQRHTANASVACFSYTGDAGTLLVVANTKKTAQTWTVPTAFAGHRAVNMLDNTNLTLPATRSLDPYEYMVLNVSEATDLENVVPQRNVEGIYDLMGRKLTQITEPGCYIVNGQKIIVPAN